METQVTRTPQAFSRIPPLPEISIKPMFNNEQQVLEHLKDIEKRLPQNAGMPDVPIPKEIIEAADALEYNLLHRKTKALTDQCINDIYSLTLWKILLAAKIIPLSEASIEKYQHHAKQLKDGKWLTDTTLNSWTIPDDILLATARLKKECSDLIDGHTHEYGIRIRKQAFSIDGFSYYDFEEKARIGYAFLKWTVTLSNLCENYSVGGTKHMYTHYIASWCKKI
jgi:hypothetical protein